MEHTLYGMDLAKSLADAWPRTSPFHIKSYGGLYRLSPGKTKRRNTSAPYRCWDSYEQQPTSRVASLSRSVELSTSEESTQPSSYLNIVNTTRNQVVFGLKPSCPTSSRTLTQESRHPPIIIPVREDITQTVTQDTRSVELERCLNNLSRCDRKSPGPQQED